MAPPSVTMKGFPNAPELKLKVFMEGQIGKGSIAEVSRIGQDVIFTFKTPDGPRKFLNANIQEYPFGGTSYPLQILNTNFPSLEEPQAQKESISKVDNSLQEELYKNVYYWNTLPKIPAPAGTKCVLAKGIDPSASLQTVTMHFQSRKRANGGPVSCVVRMIDGILVIFQDAEDCSNCVAKTEQTFTDKHIMVFPKFIPHVYERRFIVEGVGDNTSKGTLILFLESCTENEIPPQKCLKQDQPGMYLIEYGVDLDVPEVPSLLKKIESKELEGYKLKTKSILRTDCLLLTNVSNEVSNDVIKLNLENKKRFGGGSVTRIDRTKNRFALVYFSLIEDAERIYQTAEKSNNEIIIDGSTVEVHLYHHSFSSHHLNMIVEEICQPKSSSDHKRKSGLLQRFKADTDCDQSILQFITNSENQQKLFKEYFKRFATIEFEYSHDGQIYTVYFTPKKQDSKLDQETFEKKCINQLERLLSQEYTVMRKTFDENKLNEVRSHGMFQEIKQSYTGNENAGFLVRWQKEEPTVEVIGRAALVDKQMKLIESYATSTSNKKSWPADQYKLFIHCGVFDEIRKQRKNLHIRRDDPSYTITFFGPESDVLHAQLEVLQMAMGFEKRKLTGLDESIMKYLSESLKSELITDGLQNELKTANVKASLGYDDDAPYIRARSSDDFHKALQVIKKVIIIKIIQLDDRKVEALSLLEWQEFKKNLSDSDLYRIFVNDKDNVTVVGLKSHVENIRRQIESYLHENEIQRFFLCTKYGKAKYVKEHSHDFSDESCKKKKITCEMSDCGGGGIYIEGKRRALDSAHRELLALEKGILEFLLLLSKPGVSQYYHDDEGKSFLDRIERVHKCTILLDSPDCEEWKQKNLRSASSNKKNQNGSSVDQDDGKLIEATFLNGKVTFSVWKADIIEHSCDVIVNTSNEDLTLLPKGISGAIKKYDDKNFKEIQKEMMNILGNNYDRVNHGEAHFTGAGSLPNCKGIVHVVGPRWHHMPEEHCKRVLKSCVANTLETLQGLKLPKSNNMCKSVAIPAISCGAFSGKASDCIPPIFEAVEDFFKDHTKTSINQVHFIEFSSQDVIDEFIEAVKKYDVVAPKPKTEKTPQKPVSSPSSPFCKVSIVHGDIADQNTDVIVIATDPKNVTKMANGPIISKILAQKAGKQVQRECANLQGPFTVGSVLETNGGKLTCKRLYHTLIEHYHPGTSEKILADAIIECLAKADASQYRSIAFPAVATGGYQYPPDLVAKVMKETTYSFQPSDLQEISIVLYPGNKGVIDAFDNEFDGTGGGTASAAPEPTQEMPYAFEEYHEVSPGKQTKFRSSFKKIDDFTGFVGNLAMSICEGDITNMSGDVIVNSTNQEFKLDQGMVSSKILKKGGPQIQVEASKKASRDADFIITGAGNLPCKQIVHLVTPKNPDEIHKRIVKVLKEMERRKVNSVYMPAFGTGMLQLEVDTIASIMRTSIEDFAKSYNPTHLGFVSIVIFDKKILQKFQNGFFHPEKKKSFMERMISGIKDFFYPQQPSGSSHTENARSKIEFEDLQDENSFYLFLYSIREENINQAVNDIQKEADRQIKRQQINDSKIQNLTEWERFEIQEIAKNFKVKLYKKEDRYLGTHLFIEGTTKEVNRATEQIKDLLRDFAAAEMCTVYINWERKNQSEQWEVLPTRTQFEIEKAYKIWESNPSSNSKVKIKRFKEGEVITEEVDLNDTLVTAGDPNIRRQLRENQVSDRPPHWDDMGNDQVKLIKLQPNSSEYQNVMQKFQGNPPFHQAIVTIERVQHIPLYLQYAAKKSELTHKLKSFPNPIELQLFHGTMDSEKIIQHGFDRSYAGKNAIVYGRGVYFAVRSDYSHRYAQPNQQTRQRRMFLADVLTGEYCAGNQNLLAPPPKPNSTLKNDIYDSVVDQMANPTIYVIFKDASAYPSYLITYT